MAYKKILFRRDTAANWTSENPTLAIGEIGLETDTDKIKLGDGSTAWNSLLYFYGSLDNSNLDQLQDVTYGSFATGQFLRWNGSAWVNDSSATASFTGAEIDAVRIGVTAAGEIDTTSGGLTLDSTSGTVTVDDNLVVTGNLTVSGTTTTVNTETVTIADNIIVLNSDETGSPTANAGIEIERGTSANVVLRWNESDDKWEITTDGSNYYTLARVLDVENSNALDTWHQPVRLATNAVLPNSPSYSAGSAGADGSGVGATLTATTYGRLVVDLQNANTGNRILVKNQGTATQNGVYTVTAQGSESEYWVLTRAADFDGSYTRQVAFGDAMYAAGGFANGLQMFAVSVDGSGANGQIVFGTDSISFEQISGTATIQAGNGLTATGNSIDVAVGAGLSVSANEVDLAAVAQSNNSASVPTSIFLTGVTVDGYGRVTGSSTASVEVALGSQTTGSYVASLNQGNGVTITNNDGEGATPTIAIGQDVSNTASVQFASVSAAAIAGALTGNVTGNVTGNASTASQWQTGRTITLSGDLTGSVTVDGSQNVTLAATVASDAISLGADTVGNYVVDVAAGTGVTVAHTQAEGSTATVSIGQSVATSATPTFAGINLNGNLVFEGATADEYETTITVTDPTADRTITIPNITGTVVTTGDSGTVTSTMIADGTIVDADINASAAIAPSKISGTAITAADTGTVTSTMIADGTIVNGDINASAAIALSKLASGTSGQIIVANASGVPTYVSESGDVTIDADGVTSISSGVIVNADINASAAIDDTKLATISTADKVSLSALNIDGGTDIGAALADADLIIVDDGGAGTNRKSAVTRVPEYVFSKVSGDVTIASNGAATIAANSVALGTDTTGNYVGTITAGTGVSSTGATSGEGIAHTISIGQSVATSASVTFARLETTGNVVVGGDLSVTGTLTTVNETNLAIEDTFIYLNDGSTTTNPDLGWAGNYNDGTYRHAGLFRDATDGKFKFFDSYTLEPTDPINTGHASYSAAPVVAETFESTIATGTAPISVSSSTVVTNLNADLLDGQHGSYYAPLASPTFTGTVTLPSGTVTSGMISDGTIVNADINASAAIALSKLATSTAGNIIVYNSSGVPTSVAETGDVTISDTGVTAISSGVIVNADINASAAIALSKLASGTSAQVILGNSSGVPTYTTVSGDVTISDTGVTAIGSGVIVNADVNASAAIAHSKLANATAGQVLLGTTTTGVITATTVSGDVTITGGGVTAIASGVVVDADINASAAITHSKLANITAGSVLMGNASNVPTATALSGDVTVNSSGVTAIASGVIVNADISSSAAIELGKLADVSTNAQTASYTLVLADKNKIVEISNASANTLTVPPNSSVAFPVGSQINVLQTGAGQTTITAGAGVTINGTPGLKVRAQWSYVTLIKRATDTWVAVGDLSA